MRVPERVPVPLAHAASSTAGAAGFTLPPGGAAPPDETRGGLSLTQILTILRAYWKHSVVIAIAVAVISAGVIKIMPKIYTATATMMVSYEVNDPLAGKEFPLQLLTSYISTQMELMQSSEVLLGVVDQLDLTHDTEFTGGYRGDGFLLRDWVKDQVAKGVAVTQGTLGSQLIYVRASSRRPDQAAAIANAVANVYLDQHEQRTSGPANERAARYRDRLAELKTQVDTLQQKVAQFRDQTGVAQLTPAGADADQALLNSLEQRYQDAQNTRRGAEVKHAALGSEQVSNSLLIQGLKGKLSNEESELAQKRQTLGPAHPQVLALQSEIESTRASINQAVQSFAGSADVDLKEARALEDKLRHAVEEQRAKMLTLRNVQDEGGNLRLELESAQAAYRRALDNADAMTVPASDTYSNVHLVTRAQIPLKPEKPNKLKLLVLGIMAGIGLGLVIPLIYELLLNRRIRCRDDIERDLGVDVLVELKAVSGLGGAA